MSALADKEPLTWPEACHDEAHHVYADRFTVPSLHFLRIILTLLVTVAGAAVSVAATAVSITASAVETTVDGAAAGVDAVAGDDEDEEDED